MKDESAIELLILGEPGTVPEDIREAERDRRRDLERRTTLMVAADWLVMRALKGNAPALAAYELHRPTESYRGYLECGTCECYDGYERWPCLTAELVARAVGVELPAA